MDVSALTKNLHSEQALKAAAMLLGEEINYNMKKQFVLCSKCDNYHWSDKNCDPFFYIYNEEYSGNIAKKISAVDHEEAAEKYADWYNSNNDYCLLKESINIIVVDEKGTRKELNISATPSIDYHVKDK